MYGLGRAFVRVLFSMRARRNGIYAGRRPGGRLLAACEGCAAGVWWMAGAVERWSSGDRGGDDDVVYV